MNVIWHVPAGSWMKERLAVLGNDNNLNIRVIKPREYQSFRAELPDTDVLWHGLEPFTSEYFDIAPRLKLIQKIGVGVNTIDVETATSRGIPVCNMPGTNTRAVVEHVLALMLSCLRRLPDYHWNIKNGERWSLPFDIGESCGEIAGQTIGLVGFGAVPRMLAPILEAMGAKVIYTSHSAKSDVPYPCCELDEMLAEADIVSLHVPLLPETKQLIDRAALWSMKPGGILINTARGGLVDEEALVDALQSGRLAMAGLDVFETEPIPDNAPILSVDNVVVTPHIAWLTRNTLERSLKVAVENCRRIREGEPLLYQVN